MIREGKADFTSVKHFRHFFEQEYGRLLLFFFFGERRVNGASSWISPKKGRLFELRQEHSYQEMAHCIDLNVPINVQTIGPLFQVTPAQTKPKFVGIIGNLRRDKLSNQGGRECYIAL